MLNTDYVLARFLFVDFIVVLVMKFEKLFYRPGTQE